MAGYRDDSRVGRLIAEFSQQDDWVSTTILKHKLASILQVQACVGGGILKKSVCVCVCVCVCARIVYCVWAGWLLLMYDTRVHQCQSMMIVDFALMMYRRIMTW